MTAQDHIKVSHLMDSATAGVLLDSIERQHLDSCEACQDILDIFIRELGNPAESTLPQKPAA